MLPVTLMSLKTVSTARISPPCSGKSNFARNIFVCKDFANELMFARTTVNIDVRDTHLTKMTLWYTCGILNLKKDSVLCNSRDMRFSRVFYSILNLSVTTSTPLV